MITVATTSPLTDTGCTWPSGIHAMVAQRCTRCGHTATPVVEHTASPVVIKKFEEILDAEALVRSEKAGVAFAPLGTPPYRKDAAHRNLARAETTLFLLVDALSLEELRAFGAYRKAALAQSNALQD